MSLQSFQKAYQKISQLNQFLISMTYGLFTRTAVKIELGHAAIPQLLQSSTKFVLSNMLYFNSTNRLHNNKRDIQHLVFTLQPFLLCGENAGKTRKLKIAYPAIINKLSDFTGTRSRDRTGTAITGHRILSPACLPIPPSGRSLSPKDAGKSTKIFTICQNLCNLSSPHRRRAGTSGFPDRGGTR